MLNKSMSVSEPCSPQEVVQYISAQDDKKQVHMDQLRNQVHWGHWSIEKLLFMITIPWRIFYTSRPHIYMV